MKTKLEYCYIRHAIKAHEAVLELEVKQINSKDGIENIVAKLDKLYLKDKM